jgi:hypothetical protein
MRFTLDRSIPDPEKAASKLIAPGTHLGGWPNGPTLGGVEERDRRPARCGGTPPPTEKIRSSCREISVREINLLSCGLTPQTALAVYL